MEPLTLARCSECGYENNRFFRYCGMCGTPLRAGDPPLPPVAQEPVLPAARIPDPVVPSQPLAAAPPPPVVRQTEAPPPRPLTISGVSILGLGADDSLEEPEYNSRDNGRSRRQESLGLGLRDGDSDSRSGDSSYLLEDEEEHSWRGRVFVGVLLFALALGAAFWHWQSNGYPWESAVRERDRRPTVADNPPAPVAPAPAPASSPVASAPTVDTPPLKPSPVPVQTALPPPLPADENTESSPATAAKTPAPDPNAEDDSAPAAKEPPAPAPHKVERPAPPARPRAPQVSPNDPAQLYAEGEKYLYGDGVPRDCDRAQRDLRTAATHSYPQAESLLATMYASGHCLGRDLPAAYRWYARALRHDPGNPRITSDLEVLWNQMTPAERKEAQIAGQ